MWAHGRGEGEREGGRKGKGVSESELSLVLLLIRTLVLSDQGLTFMTSFLSESLP